MLIFETFLNFVFRKPIILMAHLALLILPLVPLAGCTVDGAGGPVDSSLSTPTGAAAGSESDQAPNDPMEHARGEEDPVITMVPTEAGVTADLTWDPPSGVKVAGYYIYYRKCSSEEPSSEESASEDLQSKEPPSCSRGERQAVEVPYATITGLEPNTEYFFDICAFNENKSKSLCSNEITAVTPLAQF